MLAESGRLPVGIVQSPAVAEPSGQEMPRLATITADSGLSGEIMSTASSDTMTARSRSSGIPVRSNRVDKAPPSPCRNMARRG